MNFSFPLKLFYLVGRDPTNTIFSIVGSSPFSTFCMYSSPFPLRSQVTNLKLLFNLKFNYSKSSPSYAFIEYSRNQYKNIIVEL